jgi:hypothetical protein
MPLRTQSNYPSRVRYLAAVVGSLEWSSAGHLTISGHLSDPIRVIISRSGEEAKLEIEINPITETVLFDCTSRSCNILFCLAPHQTHGYIPASVSQVGVDRVSFDFYDKYVREAVPMVFTIKLQMVRLNTRSFVSHQVTSWRAAMFQNLLLPTQTQEGHSE